VTQRTKLKRQRSAVRAPRKPPKLCEKCGAKPGDEHDTDAHYRAMLERIRVRIQEGEASAR
jgi:hypothetical protein